MVKDQSCKLPNSEEICSSNGNCVSNSTQLTYICQCCPGFEGKYCETYNPCYNNLCQNDGTCIPDPQNETNITCSCTQGYTGEYCEEKITDACWALNCPMNSSCIEMTNGNYTCLCSNGYTGTNCDNLYSGCHNNPCKNGICQENGENSYNCYCIPGYHGYHCEIQIDECESNPCQHGGKCEDLLNGFKCHCKDGHKGDLCEIKVDLCHPNPCHNATKCIDVGETFKCVCKPGFSGHRCDRNINDCASHPCLNGAICHDRVNGYHCACTDTFVGTRCQFAVDLFAPQPMENHPYSFRDSTRAHHIHSIYILGGTLGGALVFVLIILGTCYCRLHRSYSKIWHRRPRYRRHRDECTKLTLDISNLNNARPSIDAVWEATLSSYQDNDTWLPSNSSLPVSTRVPNGAVEETTNEDVSPKPSAQNNLNSYLKL
ncbi:delta and Notch-like epidermal growth factor-related receptor [Octopus bimaculoides]|uniref:delta and Notch-like epidermal growth factor-related receptor n=1 Tax=Octopus bimaculoides TaxID=37653 RepID=UPI0022E94235|nr:delta and Notch-like epidermal growth factor-related receptor [Octopus bimaculoides]